MDKFLSDVDKVYKANKKVIVAVSEGAKLPDGRYVADSGVRDSFGHAQLERCCQHTCKHS